MSKEDKKPVENSGTIYQVKVSMDDLPKQAKNAIQWGGVIVFLVALLAMILLALGVLPTQPNVWNVSILLAVAGLSLAGAIPPLGFKVLRWVKEFAALMVSFVPGTKKGTTSLDKEQSRRISQEARRQAETDDRVAHLEKQIADFVGDERRVSRGTKEDRKE